MGTNASIAVELNDGTVKQVYLHWDGYVSWAGMILNRYYNSYEKAVELVKLGALSSLNERINPIGKEHSFNNPEPNVTIAYHRDRGEDLHINKYSSYDEYISDLGNYEYEYIFRDGQWSVTEGRYFIRLSEALEQDQG